MTAYLFDEFALNTSRCRLMRSDKVIELRPKSFEVLRHLVENADRLITKDELLNAVWPGVHVSEDSLTQCVMEVRRALDDKNHALLKTVPKRGYIFAGTVLAGDEGSQSAARTSLHGRWRWDWLRPTALVLGGLIAGVILTLSLPLLVGEIEGARHIGNLVSNAETAIGQTLATYPTGTPVSPWTSCRCPQALSPGGIAIRCRFWVMSSRGSLRPTTERADFGRIEQVMLFSKPSTGRTTRETWAPPRRAS